MRRVSRATARTSCRRRLRRCRCSLSRRFRALLRLVPAWPPSFLLLLCVLVKCAARFSHVRRYRNAACTMLPLGDVEALDDSASVGEAVCDDVGGSASAFRRACVARGRARSKAREHVLPPRRPACRCLRLQLPGSVQRAAFVGAPATALFGALAPRATPVGAPKLWVIVHGGGERGRADGMEALAACRRLHKRGRRFGVLALPRCRLVSRAVARRAGVV